MEIIVRQSDLCNPLDAMSILQMRVAMPHFSLGG